MGIIEQQPIDYNIHPRVNSSDPVPPRPRPQTPAHVIKSDAEAIEIARRLADEFTAGAALRDREGLLPLAEIDAYSQSGLWGINVPKAHGGAGVSYRTLARVIAIIAAADSSIAQITQNHLSINGHIDLDGTEAQKREFFGWVLSGLRFGNAFSELNSKNVGTFETRVAFDGDVAVVNGEKFYTTGALLSHIIPVVAVDDEGKSYLVFVDRDAQGITVTNNWSSFGQRTTASGSVRIENVRVPKSRLSPVLAFDRPTVAGPVSQIIQAAIDAGIARGAIDDAIAFIKTQSRPWIDSAKETAGEDPFHRRNRRPEDTSARRRSASRHRWGSHRYRSSERYRGHDRGGDGENSGSQGADDRDRHSGHQQAVRAGRHALHPCQAQSRPPLAQCSGAYLARSRTLEIFSRREFLPERPQPATSRLELTTAGS